jgi:YD repeat-containing protein
MLPEETSSVIEVISDTPTPESPTPQIPEVTTEHTPEHTYVTFRYDAMGRRFEKIILNSSGSTIENISYVYS